MKPSNKNKSKRDRKDVFGAHLLKGAEFDIEHYDIPFVDVPKNAALPKKLVPYSKIGSSKIDKNTFVHFYQHDYVFDSLYGIWNSLLYDHQSEKGFNLDKLKKLGGIICPDYSIYGDFPEALKIWNVYRSRSIGYYLNSIGIPAFPNFHCNGPDSYSYCFGGLRKGTIVAVSTLGCLKAKVDRQIFLPGLEELIIRIKPKLIILYGSKNKEIEKLFVKYKQKYLFFESDISQFYGGKSHGNESK